KLESLPSSPTSIPETIPDTASPVHNLNIQYTPTPPEHSPVRSKRLTTFWVWFFFLLSLGICVVLVALSSFETRLPMSKSRILLNPRDIDIHMVNKSCNNWTSPYQRSYAIGVGDLVATSLNTFSTFMVHDKTNYNIDEPSSSGKTLSIAFVNQRQYRAQQCFMSVKLVDNADGSTMLDKRYVITNGNQLAIQNDLLESLSKALNQPWPQRMQEMFQQFLPHRGALLTNFYQAHDYLMHGDDKSLNRASELLGEILESSPDFIYARAEKALVDIVRHSQHPLDEKQLAALNTEIDNIGTMPGVNNLSIFYQIKTVSALEKGKIDDAYQAINTGIDLEMSWLNYVLLGKVYEMKGMNREAADAYLTAFNLRPGENTLYWIENGVFQTSVPYVVPYLDKFLSSE
ncbi:lysine decarboxylation/transport transcriptional activator CadC, partial [Escherichia albertii]|nr:lysine decarboxylation/transport transcriptional activator CadC [Escherichia albertii]